MSKIDTLNQMNVHDVYSEGSRVDHILVDGTAEHRAVLKELGVDSRDIHLAELSAEALCSPDTLDLGMIAWKYTEAKWFDPMRYAFVPYAYEERFLHEYEPFRRLVDPDELQSMSAETQLFVSLMTSYTALLQFINDERDRCFASADLENPYLNAVATSAETTAILNDHDYTDSMFRMSIQACLDSECGHAPVSDENKRIACQLLQSYLHLYPIFTNPDLDATAVFPHLYRRGEVLQLLDAWKDGNEPVSQQQKRSTNHE